MPSFSRLNTSTLPNVKVIEAAIASEPGRISWRNPSNQAWAVQTKRSKDGATAACTIPEIISDISGPAEAFLVKTDIEGFEADLFAKNVDWVDKVDVIIIEPNNWLFPGEGKSRNFQKVRLPYCADRVR